MQIATIAGGIIAVIAGVVCGMRAYLTRRRRGAYTAPIYINDGWERVWLASYPRSGSHWVRHLIEEATGVSTGSVGRDRPPRHVGHIYGLSGIREDVRQHSREPQPWGGYRITGGYAGSRREPTQQDAILIKTHFPAQPATSFDTDDANRAIVLMRDPARAIVSYWNYLPPRKRGNWEDFVMREVKGWRQFISHWDSQPTRVFVRYAELQLNPHDVLTEMLAYAGYKATRADIDRAVTCYPPRVNEIEPAPAGIDLTLLHSALFDKG